MVSFESATDDELVAIASRFPEAFAPQYTDYWEAYFETLERHHLVEGLGEVLVTTDSERDLFTWYLAPFVSRLHYESILDALDRWSDVIPSNVFAQLVRSCATFATSPRTRRAVYESYVPDLVDVTEPIRRGIELQFCESPSTFRREWLHGWVMEYRSSVSYLTRCALLNFDSNSNGSVHIWAHGFPIRPAEPTVELVFGLRDLYEETQSYYEDRDAPLELYKGTTFDRIIASTAESWTDEKSVADEYDGHSVLESIIEPETVFLSYEVVENRANVYSPQARKTFVADSEYVVFGGGIE